MHMNLRLRTKFLLALLGWGLAFYSLAQSQTRQLPQSTLLRIVKAEDERRWDGDLRYLLTSPRSGVRTRAALAAGRIGNEGALPELSNILRQDRSEEHTSELQSRVDI